MTVNRTYLRLAGAALLLGVLAVGGWLGWRWQATLKLEAIEVTGAQHAVPDSLVALARVDTGRVLFDVDPAFVADRVRRHPWVRTAEATRLPTGTLAIHVTERMPAALVLSGEGRPSHYLDAEGHQMPLEKGAAFDVPLLRGALPDYHPVRPVQDKRLRALLAVLAEADRPLVSEVEVGAAGVTLHTTPTGGRGSVPVQLGTGAFRAKLDALDAFWQQAVLTQPATQFERIDLRFHGQVVTEEAPPDSSKNAQP